MCTVVLLRRPDHDWPVLVAANRDELRARPWRAPGRHWPDRPGVVAGIDELAGGSWIGMNDEGVVAGVLNRVGSLGPAPGLRSRGELVLEALDHADALDAATALADLDSQAYRSFNLFVADNRDAYLICNRGEARHGRVEVQPLTEGLSMLTAHGLSDRESARVRLYMPRFAAAAAPDPARGDWASWEHLLASREELPGHGPESAMSIETGGGFGTSSSSLIALPAIERPALKPVWLFAAGAPAPGAFHPVDGLRAAPAAPIVSRGRA